MKIKIVYWIPVIAWMTIIFLFSAQNGNVSSETSSLPAEILAKIIRLFIGNQNMSDVILNRCQFIVRKLAHFSVYAVLGIFSYNAFRKSFKLPVKLYSLLSASLCLLYAISDELHQSFVPGRSCQLRDVLIDFSGAVLGIILVSAFIRLISKKRKI